MNHEWLFDVDIDNLIQGVITQLHYMGSDYTVEKNVEEYNDDVASISSGDSDSDVEFTDSE